MFCYNHNRSMRSVVHRIVLASMLVCVACASDQRAESPSYDGAIAIDVSQIRFDDGDTFFLDDEPIRVLGIDTPEIAHPDLGIMKGQPYGDVAAESTRVWLSRAHRVEYVPDGRDRYNRRLAHVFVDGELLALRLIRSGLAYETVTYYGDGGFPDLAQQIVDAARSSPKPPFEPPSRWKSKQRKRKQS